MPRYDALPASLPPRGLAREAAAQYVGVGPTKFDNMVGDGRMPRPVRIDGRVVWDIRALDHAFDALNDNQARLPTPPEVIATVVQAYSERLSTNKQSRNLDDGQSRTISLNREAPIEEKGVRRGKWKYVHTFVDRHGKTRHYFRRPGFPVVPLPDDQDTLEFLDAYRAALGGEVAPKSVAVARKTPISSRCVDACVGRFLTSKQFLDAPVATQKQYGWHLRRFRRDHPSEDFPSLQRGDYIRIIKPMTTASTKRDFIKAVRALRTFLKQTEEKMFAEDDEDPTKGIKIIVPKTEGFYSWEESDIAYYRETYLSGTQERRALELLLWLGQRGGDTIRMGPKNIVDGKIQLRQRKTGRLLELPIAPELQVELDFVPEGQSTFLVNGYGRPFADQTFRNWFRVVCDAVPNLPKAATAHGLRKAACRRLAEAGCTTKEIQAISGHLTLSEVEKYVKAADQGQLGDAAQEKLRRKFS